MTDKSTFIRCDCHGEMLEVMRFEDDPETYLSFWYYGGMDGKMRWAARLKLCWKVLREGRGHPDHLVLAPNQVSELRSALGDPKVSPAGGSTITVWPTTMVTGTLGITAK